MIYILMALAVFTLDCNLKNYIERHFKLSDKKDILKGRITVRKQYNSGFCLNVMDNRIDIVKKASAAILGAVVLVFMMILPGKKKTLTKLGLSLCIGGAASNVKDRFNKGYVVDYFSINFKPIKHIVFNLADIFIFIGSIMVFLTSLHNPEKIDNLQKKID